MNPPQMLGYSLSVKFEFLFFDSLHYPLRVSVEVKRISITSIYFLASFWVFFRSLKYQDQDGTYSLALIGSVSWLICQYSEVKEVKKCSGHRLGIQIFLIVSAKGVAVPSAERNHSGLVEIPLANKNGFNLRAPLVRQCFEQKGNSQELDKYCL